MLLFVALASAACSDDKPGPWAGHTYMLSIGSKDYSYPSNIGDDLFGVAPTFFLKIGGSGKNLTATLATGPGTTTDDADLTKHPRTPDNAEQDTCGPTTTIAFSGADYPHSTIAVDDARMFLLNPTTPPLQVTADVYGLKFTDILPDGDAPSKTGTFEATMDFEQIVILFGALGPTRTAESACQLSEDHYMIGCQACPTASASATCLTVQADAIGALAVPSLTVTEVSETARPPTCADSQLD